MSLKILNQIIGELDSYANLLLVIITAVYAFLTFRMVSIMKKQIASNIKVSKISLQFHITLDRESFSDITMETLVEKMALKKVKELVLLWHVSIDFLNLSSGGGSIDQPKLVIKFKKDKFIHEVRPTGERIGGTRKTIFLPGGGFEKFDLEYFCSCNENNKKLVGHLKNQYKNLKYYVSYKDNSGKKHLVKIDDVSGIK